MSVEMAYIRQYRPVDEMPWLRCRVLAFLDCAYYDDVVRTKPTYDNPAIELVAEVDDQIIGFLDIEQETQPGSICSKQDGLLGGMIWELGVHPDYRRQVVATALFEEGKRQARESGLVRLEAWTRDDECVHAWYEAEVL